MPQVLALIGSLLLALTGCATDYSAQIAEQKELSALEKQLGLPEGFKVRTGMPVPACELSDTCESTDVMTMAIRSSTTAVDACTSAVNWISGFDGAMVDPTPTGEYVQRLPSEFAVAVDKADLQVAIDACVAAVTGSPQGNGNHYAVLFADTGALTPGSRIAYQVAPYLADENSKLPAADAATVWNLTGRVGMWPSE